MRLYEAYLYRWKYPVLLLLLWCIYLAVNDVRKNPHTFWRGLISRFVGIAETKSLSLSFSKRMVRRFVPVVLAGLFLGIGAVAAAVNYDYFYGYDGAVYLAAVLLVAAAFFGVSCWYLVKTKRQAEDLDALVEAINVIHDGDYGRDNVKAEIALPEDSEFASVAAKLDDIRNGITGRK